MKNTVKALISCAAVMCGVLLIIHRRVIVAAITGEPIPEMPEWHKKMLCCSKKQNEE